MRTVRSLLGTAAAAVLVVVALGAPSPASAAPTTSPRPAPLYLALGDSLAASVQPGPGNVDVVTDRGYAEKLAAIGRIVAPGLVFEQPACPGETTTTFVEGGICDYPAGSQLDTATELLRSADGPVVVTVHLGANNLFACLAGTDPSAVDPQCVADAYADVATELTTILATLRAASPDAVILGANYYNPFLATWISGPTGPDTARLTNQIVVGLNDVLGQVYGAAGVPVADVEAAYRTTDFSGAVPLPGIGPVPVNVARICLLTGMCVAPPTPFSVHPTTVGYLPLVGAFLGVPAYRQALAAA